MPVHKPALPRDPAFADQVLAATARLRDRAAGLNFADPVAFTYNPLEYAWDLHAAYVSRWCASPRRVLMLGMNPGPWGMAQTGVPFGEVAAVKGWLDLGGAVGKPDPEHPKRPVLGLECARSEVSGRRLWGYFQERFGSPEAFFAEHVIVNYCPLVFMEDSGRNRTPDKLPVAESGPLFAACEERLGALIGLYRPHWLVGVGGFARKKLEALVGKDPADVRLGTLLHPSPASPADNRGRAEAAARQLAEQGIWPDSA